MKILTFWFLFCGAVSATSYAPLDFPPEPIPAQLLERNGLARADEVALLSYVETNWESAGSWIANITEQEDVWPLIREPLPDSVFYSRVGDFWPSEFTLVGKFNVAHLDSIPPDRTLDHIRWR